MSSNYNYQTIAKSEKEGLILFNRKLNEKDHHIIILNEE